MTEETRTALRNYDWLMRNRRDVALYWDEDGGATVMWGDGGATAEVLLERGFTPATE